MLEDVVEKALFRKYFKYAPEMMSDSVQMMLDLCFCQEYPQIEGNGDSLLDEEVEAVEPKRVGFDNWARNRIPLAQKQKSTNNPSPSPVQKQRIERIFASKDFDSIDPSSFSNQGQKVKNSLKGSKITPELV